MEMALLNLPSPSVLDLDLLFLKELLLSSGSRTTVWCRGDKFVFQIVPGFGILKRAQGQECYMK